MTTCTPVRPIRVEGLPYCCLPMLALAVGLRGEADPMAQDEKEAVGAGISHASKLCRDRHVRCRRMFVQDKSNGIRPGSAEGRMRRRLDKLCHMPRNPSTDEARSALGRRPSIGKEFVLPQAQSTREAIGQRLAGSGELSKSQEAVIVRMSAQRMRTQAPR